MKKILCVLLCLCFTFGVTGCSSLKSSKEIKKSLTGGSFEISSDYSNKISAICHDSDKDYYLNGWTYVKDKDILVFNENGNDEHEYIVIVDVKKEIAYEDLISFTNDDSVSQEIIENIINNSSELASSLDLSIDEIKKFLKEELDNQISQYKKMTYKEKLAVKFEDEDAIQNLTEEEAKKYFELYEKNNDLSFNELQEEAYLQDQSTSIEIKTIINNMKDKSKNSTNSWKMKNFKLQKSEETSAVWYDWYIGYNDTLIDFVFLYDTNTNKYGGVSMYSKGAKFDVDDVEDILAMYMVLMQCVDETIDATTAMSIANNCYEHDYEYNGNYYYISLEGDLQMMIVPKQ